MIRRKFRLSALPTSTYIFVLVFVFFGLTVPKFWSPANLSTLLLQSSVMLTIAMGMALVIMTGGVDLSMGGNISLCAVVAGALLRAGQHWAIAIVAALLTGTAIGFLNGIVVQKMKVVPFIATFGMANIAQSLANTIAGKRTVYWEPMPQNQFIDTLSKNLFSYSFGEGKAADVLSLAYISLACLVAILVVNVAFQKTRLGPYVYAIGANQETARLSGIQVDRWRIGVFMLAGCLSAIAGCMLMIRTQAVQPTLGDGLEFYAVVSAVLGGNMMSGGKGSVAGAMLGVLVLYSIRSALTLMGVSTFWVMVVVGVVLIVGMVINSMVQLYEKKALMRTRQTATGGDRR